MKNFTKLDTLSWKNDKPFAICYQDNEGETPSLLMWHLHFEDKNDFEEWVNETRDIHFGFNPKETATFYV